MKQRPIVWFAVCWTLGAALALGGGIRAMPPAGAVCCAALLAVCYLLAVPGRFWIGGVLVLGLSLGYNAWYDGRNVSELTAIGMRTAATPETAANAAARLSGEEIAEGVIAGEERAEAGGEPSVATEAEVSGGPGEAPEDKLDKLPVRIRGTIASPVEVDGDRVSFTAKAREAALGEGTPVPLNETLQVSVRLASQAEQTAAREWRRGDGIAFAGELRRPSSVRNEGGFDYRRYLYLRHIHWQAVVKGAGGIDIAPPEPRSAASALGLLDALRDGLGERLDRWFGPAQGGFMKSLLLGIRDDFDPEQFRQFSRLGLTHILAISGLHVAVVLGGLAFLLRALRVTRETNLIVCMIFVPFYVLVTGASPSVVRSGLMALLALYAIRARILKDALHLAAMAALLMLAVNPYYLFDVGCQLSFLVTIGLIVGVPRFHAIVPLRPKWWADAVAVTTVAQLISFPLTIYYFNQFSLLSWLANLLLVPLYSLLILPLGMFSLTLGLLWDPLGAWIAWPTVRINEALGGLVARIAGWRWGETIWASPPLWWLAAYYLLLAGLNGALKIMRETGRTGAGAAAACALIVLLAYGYHPVAFERTGTVSFIDVGQGDSILVRTPEHRTLLIDGGGTLNFRKAGEDWRNRRDPYEVGRKLLVPLLKQRGVRTIDWLMVSHQDIDHIGGLQAVLEEIPVRRLLFNGTLKPGGAAEKLFETALQKNVVLYEAVGGETLELDKHTRLRIIGTRLAAGLQGDDRAEAAEDGVAMENEQNDRSIVAMLTVYERSFLFSGDLGAKGERLVLAAEAREDVVPGASGDAEEKVYADVLKVAHHGSKTSTTPEWLARWKPKHAVISVGLNNSYGHPAPAVVERLEAQEMDIWRTDRDGEVRFVVTPEGELKLNAALQPLQGL